MQFNPSLELGILNGWILLVGFYVMFGLMLLVLPKAVVERLYDRTGQPDRLSPRRIAGVLFVLIWFLLVIFTPLPTGTTAFYFGLFVYFLGWIGMMVSLSNYSNTPLDQPVTDGIYRISRHPQQVSLSLVFLGISFAIGSGVALLLIGIGLLGGHWRILAEEQACLERYGEDYRRYMESIPRYFLFF